MKPIITIRARTAEDFNNALLELEFGPTIIIFKAPNNSGVVYGAFDVRANEVRVVRADVSKEDSEQFEKTLNDTLTIVNGTLSVGYGNG